MLSLKTEWQYEVAGARQHYLVEARLANELVGRAYGWCEPNAGFVVEKIEVEQPHRSCGYGSRLIECMRARARECGCREFVFKGVRVGNEGAIRLYRSLGAVDGPVIDGLVSFVLRPP